MNAKNGAGVKRVMILMDEKLYAETKMKSIILRTPLYQHINNILAKAAGMAAPKIKHPSNKYSTNKENKEAEAPPVPTPAQAPTTPTEGSV